MTTNNKAAMWLEAALDRAKQIERDHAERWHELTPYQPRPVQAVAYAPAWLTVDSTIPQEQPCGFVRSMIARSHEKPALFRSFHGSSKRKAA